MTTTQATLRLSRLLNRPVADRAGESIGRLADVIVRLRGADYPLVTGLVATEKEAADLRNALALLFEQTLQRRREPCDDGDLRAIDQRRQPAKTKESPTK